MARALIVEDDYDCGIALKTVLEGEGHIVSIANDGLEALNYLHGIGGRIAPDLIILDLMMPELDGWDFLQAKNGDVSVRAIPVIVMTAMTVYEARARALEGALVIIHKPYSLERILAVVSHALRHGQQ